MNSYFNIPVNKFNNSRYAYNQCILRLLQKYFDKYPDMRFCQALYNLNIIDDTDNFLTESQKTYNTILKYPDFKNENIKNIIEYNNSQKENSVNNKNIDKIKEDINIKSLDKSDKVKSFMSYNDFNNIIKTACEKQICSYFYNNAQYDNRTTIIEKCYNYLWNKLESYNIEEILNNILKSINISDNVSDDYLYNIHLYIINALFNTYIRLTYNETLNIASNVYNNFLTFHFLEIENTNYHGSYSDKIYYKLTYSIKLDDLSDNKITEFFNTLDYFIKNNIFKLKDIYYDESSKFLKEITN